MTLAKQFPNATLDGPLEIRHEFNIFVGNRLLAGTGGTSSNLHDTYTENVANAQAIVHAVSTYDAHEAEIERLRGERDEWKAEAKRGSEDCTALGNKTVEMAVEASRLREALREAKRIADLYGHEVCLRWCGTMNGPVKYHDLQCKDAWDALDKIEAALVVKP